MDSIDLSRSSTDYHVDPIFFVLDQFKHATKTYSMNQNEIFRKSTACTSFAWATYQVVFMLDLRIRHLPNISYNLLVSSSFSPNSKLKQFHAATCHQRVPVPGEIKDSFADQTHRISKQIQIFMVLIWKCTFLHTLSEFGPQNQINAYLLYFNITHIGMGKMQTFGSYLPFFDFNVCSLQRCTRILGQLWIYSLYLHFQPTYVLLCSVWERILYYLRIF